MFSFYKFYELFMKFNYFSMILKQIWVSMILQELWEPLWESFVFSDITSAQQFLMFYVVITVTHEMCYEKYCKNERGSTALIRKDVKLTLHNTLVYLKWQLEHGSWLKISRFLSAMAINSFNAEIWSIESRCALYARVLSRRTTAKGHMPSGACTV